MWKIAIIILVLYHSIILKKLRLKNDPASVKIALSLCFMKRGKLIERKRNCRDKTAL